MTKSTEQILERIRELVPELKELKFGCEIKLKNDKESDFPLGRFISEIVLVNAPNNKGIQAEIYGTTCVQHFPVDSFNNYYEIIGLPVELNHLLSTLKKLYYPITHYKVQEILGVDTFENSKARYDMDLSVEQNLEENPALTDLIYELIV